MHCCKLRFNQVTLSAYTHFTLILHLLALRNELSTLEEEGNLRQLNEETWVEEFYSVIAEYRNINCDWKFTDEQGQILKNYHHANLILMDCLNSDCYVSRSLREEIEETLLLPIAEIERRKNEKR